MTPAERKKEFQAAHPVVVQGVSTLIAYLSNKEPDVWQNRWDQEMERKPPQAEILIGLLHFVFKPRVRPSRLCLCLQIADGYTRDELFGDKESNLSIRISDPRSVNGITWNPRHEVARKAWQALCEYVFAPFLKKDSETERTERRQLLLQSEIFNRLLWFFNPERDNLPDRYSESPNAKITREFLREFVRFAWELGDGNGDRDFDKKMAAMCREARVELLKLMAANGDIDWLLTQSTLNVDEAVMKQFEKMALTKKFLFRDESFLSIEDAVAQNHLPAQTLVLFKIKHQIEQALAEREEMKRRYNQKEQLKQNVEAAQRAVEAAQQRLAELLAVTKK